MLYLYGDTESIYWGVRDNLWQPVKNPVINYDKCVWFTPTGDPAVNIGDSMVVSDPENGIICWTPTDKIFTSQPEFWLHVETMDGWEHTLQVLTGGAAEAHYNGEK